MSSPFLFVCLHVLPTTYEYILGHIGVLQPFRIVRACFLECVRVSASAAQLEHVSSAPVRREAPARSTYYVGGLTKQQYSGVWNPIKVDNTFACCQFYAGLYSSVGRAQDSYWRAALAEKNPEAGGSSPSGDTFFCPLAFSSCAPSCQVRDFAPSARRH